MSDGQKNNTNLSTAAKSPKITDRLSSIKTENIKMTRKKKELLIKTERVK